MKKATIPQIIKINKLLDQVLAVDKDTAFYKDFDWSDERVAEEVGVSATSVAKVRKEMFGCIRKKKLSTSARLDDLETRMKILEDFVEPN